MDKHRSAFVSYTKDAGYKAEQLANHLNGVNTFIFERDMEVKRNIKDIIDEIDEEIQKRAAFILIVSKRSLTSEWIYTEIELAFRYKKPLYGLKTSANLAIPQPLSEEQIIFVTKLSELDAYFEVTKTPDANFDIEVSTRKVKDKLVHVSDWLPASKIKDANNDRDVLIYSKMNLADGDLTTWIRENIDQDEIMDAHKKAMQAARSNFLGHLRQQAKEEQDQASET